ncbi:uncharacterized protein MYCFIDRAFT_137028, partial [Pseudocercospora fijiensis CIRAD86]
GRGPFSEIRAAIQCLLHQREFLAEGYHRYLSKGKSYVFPTLNGVSEVIIPSNKLPWLLDHPDSKASNVEAHFDMLAGQYAFTDPKLLHHPFHEEVIHRNLGRKLANLIPPTWDEVKFQVDNTLGRNTEQWKEIHVLEAMTDIAAAISNRMIVGLPLCRNAKFRDLQARFAAGVMFVVMLVQLSPKLMQPIVGHLASIPNRLVVWQCKKMTLPVIEKRLADIEHEGKNSEEKGHTDIPDDYLTWQIRLAKERGDAKEYDADWITRRLMPLEFAAIHTSSFTIANILLDLLGSDPKLGYIEAIREEAETVYREANGQWTKQDLARMVKTDSAIRESMRVSGFGVRGVQRKVIDKNGLKDEEGWTAPYGSLIATDVWTRHHDPAIYPDPYRYDAFRFSRAREQEDYLKSQSLSLISTSDRFLAFGHGRHACPGRFFINLEMKLLLAYLVMNYDFQYLQKRPENTITGEVIMPPMKAGISFRRRPNSLFAAL